MTLHNSVMDFNVRGSTLGEMYKNARKEIETFLDPEPGETLESLVKRVDYQIDSDDIEERGGGGAIIVTHRQWSARVLVYLETRQTHN